MSSHAEIIENAAGPRAKPKLSVLIPFFRDDPRRLLRSLDRADAPVEIVVLEPGRLDDADLAAEVADAIPSMR